MVRPQLLLLVGVLFCCSRASAQLSPPLVAPATDRAKEKREIDPAKFVRIYEQSGTKRILLYDGLEGERNLTSRQLKAEAGSMILVEVDLDEVDEDSVLNHLFMSAQLTRGDKTEDIPVINYSQLGKDQESGASQGAVAFETIRDIRATMENMYYTTHDLCSYLGDCDPQMPLATKTAGKSAEIRARFRLLSPDLKGITDFFSDPKNKEITALIGNEIFGIDSRSLNNISKQFVKDLEMHLTAPEEESEKTPAGRALADLKERTKLIWKDFCDDMKKPPINKDCKESTQAEDYFKREQQRLIRFLKANVVPGQILLSNHKAQDGDTLLLTVETKGKTVAGMGASAKFQFALKSYGAKVAISPSMFFITRASVNAADLNRLDPNDGTTRVPINPVNFAPAPGMTLSVTALHRGLEKLDMQTSNDRRGSTMKPTFTGLDKLKSALAPGLGINVSFLNFGEARDFDPTKGTSGQFSNTNGTNFQLGAGVTLTLFNNKLQFTHGWNLNVDQRRRYFGIGFGFIEVGKQLLTVIKQQ